MDLADTDGNGTIDQGEFIIAMKSRCTKISKIISDIKEYAVDIINKKHEADLKEAFQILDQNDNGEIDTEELIAIMKNISTEITLEECKELVQMADKDGNGSVDQEEFLIAMKNT